MADSIKIKLFTAGGFLRRCLCVWVWVCVYVCWSADDTHISMAGLAVHSGLRGGFGAEVKTSASHAESSPWAILQPNLFIMTSSGERLDQSLPPFHRPSQSGSAQKTVTQLDKLNFSENCVSTLFISPDLGEASVWFRLYLRGITYQHKAFDFYQSFPGLYQIDVRSNDLCFSLCLAMFHSSPLRKISFSLYSAI